MLPALKILNTCQSLKGIYLSHFFKLKIFKRYVSKKSRQQEFLIKAKMWPLLLDNMTKDESMQTLRCLEFEAYSGLVTALRAQGPLDVEKLKLLKDACSALDISQDQHKAEVRRAVYDKKINTIAYHNSAQKVASDEWAQKGRRLIPPMPRVAPQTAYAAIADEVADAAGKNKKQLPKSRKKKAGVYTYTN